MVDSEQRWDGGRPDVEDPGVCYFTVNLHHHLELFVPDDAVCKGGKDRAGLLLIDASVTMVIDVVYLVYILNQQWIFLS